MDQITRREMLAGVALTAVTPAFLRAADVEAETPITVGAGLPRSWPEHQRFVFQQDGPEGIAYAWPIIEFSRWEGPGKDNKVDHNWGNHVMTGGWEDTIGRCKVETEIIPLENITIYRSRRDCYLLPDNAEYFTRGGKDNPGQWKTDYLWHGPVTLVRDVILRHRDNNVRVDYYYCATDKSIQGRKLEPGEKPEEKWLHLG